MACHARVLDLSITGGQRGGWTVRYLGGGSHEAKLLGEAEENDCKSM